MLMQTKQAFPQAKDFETGIQVDNYPWGYKFKTQRRYWVETKKGFGDRFCYATKNPKTGQWCKPKKGTYMTAMIVTQEPNGYVYCDACDRNPDGIAEFADKYWEMLTDTQKAEICKVNAFNEVMEGVKFTFKPAGTDPTATKENQDKVLKQINQAINYKAAACIAKNGLEVK